MLNSCSRVIWSSLYCLVATTAFANSSNFLQLYEGSVNGKSLAFDSEGRIDLSSEGTIEFWVSHSFNNYDAQKFTRQEEAEFNDAYSVVLAMGTPEKLGFAIVLGPGLSDSIPSSIGVVTDLSVLKVDYDSDNERKRASAFVTIPEKFERNQPYHIVLSKLKGFDRIKVFVDGRERGTIRGSFGETLGLPLHVGWKPPVPQPANADNTDGEQKQAPILTSFPFEGKIGGLRIWSSGTTVEAKDAQRLRLFGRPVKQNELAMLPEYGNLLAYGDFIESPKLVIADPLAGTWYPEGVGVQQKIDKANGSVRFVDYPIYSFVAPLGAAPSAHMASRMYNVFEDSNYIGKLTFKELRGDVQIWSFQHADDGWNPMTFQFAPSKRHLDWTLTSQRNGQTLGGDSTGQLTLRRRTNVDCDIPNLTDAQFTADEKETERTSGGMELMFLHDAYAVYRDLLYQGYNISKMSPSNLFNRGTKRTNKDAYILKYPVQNHKYHLTAHDMIVPYDLQGMPQQHGETSQSIQVISTAQDSHSAATQRVGAGFSSNYSASFTFGTGGSSPVTAQGTVTAGFNYERVWQDETVEEVINRMEQKKESIVETYWRQNYILHHHKELMQLDEKFVAAVKQLYAVCANATPTQRGEYISAFFDSWGTHYPFAVTFGSLTVSETVVDDEVREAVRSNTWKSTITVNSGETGNTGESSQTDRKNTSSSQTTSREVGGGAKDVPIAIDLRPIDALLSPQHFPDQPQIYSDLRLWMALAGHIYRNQETTKVIQAKVGDDKNKMQETADTLNGKRSSASKEPQETLTVKFKGISVIETYKTADNTAVLNEEQMKLLKLPAPAAQRVTGHVMFTPHLLKNIPRLRIGPVGVELQSRLDARTAREFLQNHPPVLVVRGDEALGPNSEKAPFGEPKRTEFSWELPDTDLQNYLAIHVGGRFTSEAFKGVTVNMPDADFATVAYALAGLNVAIPGSMLPACAGSILWANEVTPQAQVKLELNGGRYRSDQFKELRNPLSKKPYVFEKPVRGAFKQGAVFATSLIKQEKNVRIGFADIPLPYQRELKIGIHYEFGLSQPVDLKAAFATNSPTGSTFLPGASVSPVNSREGRSTNTFRMAPVYTADNFAVGDFDGDQRADVLLADGNGWYTYRSTTGQWRAERQSSAMANRLSIADFDGDGKDDIYVHGTKGHVVYSGRDYTYGSEDLHHVTTGSTAWSFAQMTDDNKTDGLLAWTPTQTKSDNWEWKVYYALPKGSANIVRTMSDTEYKRIFGGVQFGDFNGDGKADIFTTEVDPNTQKKDLTRRYFWRAQIEAGKPPVHLNTSQYSNQYLVLGDFNGDKVTDVLEVYGGWGINYGGKGNQLPVESEARVDSASALKVGDFDGNGVDDLLKIDSSGLSVLYGQKDKGLSGRWVPFGTGA